jgi:hypothetical protein
LSWLQKKREGPSSEEKDYSLEEEESKGGMFDWMKSRTPCEKYKDQLNEIVPKLSKNIGDFPKLRDIENNPSKYDLNAVEEKLRNEIINLPSN